MTYPTAETLRMAGMTQREVQAERAAREQADYAPQPSLKECVAVTTPTGCTGVATAEDHAKYPASRSPRPEPMAAHACCEGLPCVPCDIADAPAKLPADPYSRKAIPLCTGLLDYFPDALAAVAHCSKVGNDQHNGGQPLHWARAKSADHADCIVRHLVERGTVDNDGVAHSAKVAWRALALLQLEIENNQREGVA